jgi:UDP-glucose 4-epimerase
MLDPLGDFYAHAALTASVLETLRSCSPATRYVLLSSASVYGSPKLLPIRENSEIAPVSPYGYHKRMEELLSEEYAKIYGLKTAVLRIFSAYGDGLHRQVVWDIVRKMMSVSDDPLVLMGTGNESRDFIYGADVAYAAEAVCLRGAMNGECYNAAGGIETSIQRLAQMIADRVDFSSAIQFDGKPPPGYATNWHADITRIRQLGFAPRISLEEGLSLVVHEAARKLRICDMSTLS